MSPQRELLGYLQCPSAGIRWNDKVHPWTKRPCVDLIHFQANTDDGYLAALRHFRALGYVLWASASDVTVASVLLPKLDTSAQPEPKRDTVLAELNASVSALLARADATGARALRAVLALEHATDADVRCITASQDPLQAAIEYHLGRRGRVHPDSVLAATTAVSAAA